MIEILNGTRETVNYKTKSGLKLYDNDKAEDYPAHWHTEIEIIMPIINTYKCIVSGDTIDMQPGDILICCPGCIHAIEYPRTGPGRRIIFQPNTTNLIMIKEIEKLLADMSPYLYIRADEDTKTHEKLYRILIDICDAYEEADDYYESYIYSKTFELFTLIGKNFSDLVRDKKGAGSLGGHDEYIKKFISLCEYIDEHCSEDLNLDSISAMSGFSKFYFTRLFKEFTGETFYKYVNIKRIKKAEQLLVAPDTSVTDVALNCGYSSLPSFIRMFKTIKGCTPTEFKNMYWKR